jgi:tetratricopeptide (TPR) repeat protein
MRVPAAAGLGPALLAILPLLCSFGAALAHSPTPDRIAELDRAIGANPSSAALYLSRGEQHHQNGAWDRALADFDRAAVLDPEFEGIGLYRARTLLAARRPGEALVVLERLLSLRAEDPAGLALQGRALSELGRMGEAIRAFDAAIAAHPRPDPQLFLDRAAVQSAQAEVEPEAVLRGLDEGITELGPLVTLQLPAIDLERQLGRFDAALARVDTLARQSRRQDPWHTLRGEILLQAGRDEEARQALRTARGALDALSPKRRATRASAALAERIDVALHRLSAPAEPAAQRGPVALEPEVP